MNYLVYILGTVLVVVGGILYERKRTKPLSPLLPNHLNFGKRQVTLLKTLELLKQRNTSVLVETGIARAGLKQTRADGASTIVFGKWASQNEAHLYSVDIDPEATKLASECIAQEELSDAITVVTSDSVAYLESFDQKVDFLYLDSYDFPKNNPEGQRLSQEHHLKEFKAIEDKLYEQTIVLIDDCKLPNGGKGKLVIDYMLNKGWSIELKKYQTLLLMT